MRSGEDLQQGGTFIGHCKRSEFKTGVKRLRAEGIGNRKEEKVTNYPQY